MNEECGTQEVRTGVGESAADQAAPLSIVAKERMVEIIANTKGIQQDAEKVLQILNENPELDAAFCRLFNITAKPTIRDVSR